MNYKVIDICTPHCKVGFKLAQSLPKSGQKEVRPKVKQVMSLNLWCFQMYSVVLKWNDSFAHFGSSAYAVWCVTDLNLRVIPYYASLQRVLDMNVCTNCNLENLRSVLTSEQNQNSKRPVNVSRAVTWWRARLFNGKFRQSEIIANI